MRCPHPAVPRYPAEFSPPLSSPCRPRVISSPLYHPNPASLPQFLDSYKSVTLGSMATTFGVSPEFLDAELVRGGF